MFQIVTREDQISSTYSTNKANQDAINKSKLYPGLLPYFRVAGDEKFTLAFTSIQQIKKPGVALNQRIKLCIKALHSILYYAYNCKVITNNKTTITYIVPYDRRIGIVAIDASKTSFPEAYKFPAKHRFDLDLILEASTPEEALKQLYSYASQVAVWVNSFNFSNNIVVYDEDNLRYQELVIVDNISEVITEDLIQKYIHNNWVGLKYDDLARLINMSSYRDMVSFYNPDPVNKTTGGTNVLKL